MYFRFTSTVHLKDPGPVPKTTEKLVKLFREKAKGFSIQFTDDSITIESILVTIEGAEDEQKKVFVTWTNQEEDLGSFILDILRTIG